MKSLFDPADLRIRKATHDDIDSIVLLRALGQKEKINDDLSPDFSDVLGSDCKPKDPDFWNNHYADIIADSHASVYLIDAPRFPSHMKAWSQDKRQFAGFVTVYDKFKDHQVLDIGSLYNVKSPFPTGSALVHYTLQKALAENVIAVTTDARTEKAKDWFENRCGFEFENMTGYYDELHHLSLHRASFAHSLEQIEKQAGITPEILRYQV